jgi:hypothetical protein
MAMIALLGLFLTLSFPKIPSTRIRPMPENHSIIRRDACRSSSPWDVRRQLVQAATPA